jgi:NAD(P)-dependent dehydrogenase (short-subunit alcohol dehydrogenase family)
MALELAKNKIRVNSVSPGMVHTKLNATNTTLTPEDAEKDEKNNYPLGYGTPEDVAYGIIYFLSDASKWVTGTSLIMDGGATIH